jgi:hypothetical protein
MELTLICEHLNKLILPRTKKGTIAIGATPHIQANYARYLFGETVL